MAPARQFWPTGWWALYGALDPARRGRGQSSTHTPAINPNQSYIIKHATVQPARRHKPYDNTCQTCPPETPAHHTTSTCSYTEQPRKANSPTRTDTCPRPYSLMPNGPALHPRHATYKTYDRPYFHKSPAQPYMSAEKSSAPSIRHQPATCKATYKTYEKPYKYLREPTARCCQTASHSIREPVLDLLVD